MNDKQLRAFIEISKTGSFSKASGLLFLSAPALKKQMDSLEAELNVPLFRRTNQGMFLTDAGREFLGFASQAVKNLDRQKEALQRTAAKEQRTINICYNCEHIRDFVYYDALSQFKQLYPDVTVNLTNTLDFETGHYDLFLGINHADAKQIKTNFLCHFPLSCILPCRHRAASGSAISLRQLDDCDLLVPPKELLQLVRPDILNTLSRPERFSVSFNEAEKNSTSYVIRCAVKDKLSIIIGMESNLPESLIQLPLEDYCFAYNIYSYNMESKPIVKTYVEFLQDYYRTHFPPSPSDIYINTEL